MVSLYQSEYCGSWYPSDPAKLLDLVESRFDRSFARTGDDALSQGPAYVVPHAGLMYSGTVAAAAYRHLRAQQAKRVVLLGFSHRTAFDEIVVPEIEAYATPLGSIEVDWDAAVDLAHRTPFRLAPEQKIVDHSVEVQLPLLKHAAPDAKLIPIYIGRLNEHQRAAAAKALAELLDGETVLVASSDFTHYGPDYGYIPFRHDSETPDRLRFLDRQLIDGASSLDPEVFRSELAANRSNLCGRAPIELMLETLRTREGPEMFQETLDYQTSGEITGDYQQSVSYAALGYFPAEAFQVNESDQQALLTSVRETLARYEKTGERVTVPPQGGTAAIERRLAVFVTLRENGQLRGCVGCAQANKPLAESVPELALSSALDDPRFDSHEVRTAATEIEISILTPMKRIASADSFELNQHGAVIESGPHRGLLLPQVAEHYGLDRARFLEALAKKAGGGAELYRDPRTRLSIFRAQSFEG